MRILITGDKGFVGSNLRATLEPNHEVVGLEARERFRDWYDEMYAIMDTPIDGVIHVGAIAENQSDRDDIYLWKQLRDLPACTTGQPEDAQYVPDPVYLFFDLLGGKHDGRLGGTLAVYMVKSAGGGVCPRLPAPCGDSAAGHHVG